MIHPTKPWHGLALLALLATPAAAQGSRAGVYRVVGTDPARGAYAGRVELRPDGVGYQFIREVEFAAFAHNGRPVSTVWSGRALDTFVGGVEVRLELRRMGWAASGANLPSRVPADGTPMPIVGTFSPNGVELSGGYRGQGAPFADPQERWTWISLPGAQPIWVSQRDVRPAHRAPSRLEKTILFAIFNSFHGVSWVLPYVQRPEFQAAIHSAVFDRTDFDQLRRRPNLLRVIQQLVDPLNLEEAVVKANGFGKRLHVKAEEADRDALRFVDPASGTLGILDAQGRIRDDNDGCLWSGVYAYTQALRYRETGDPAALANLERQVTATAIHMEITGSPTEFARTLRTAGVFPLPSNYSAGVGPFAQIEWKHGGNNDMYKGLIWSGLAAYEGLPSGHPLRARYAAALTPLVRQHPVAQLSRLSTRSNEIQGTGVASLLSGDRRDRDRYRRLLRNPWHQLGLLAIGGGFHYQGISDWSGNHLNITSLIVQNRLAHHHSRSISKLVTKLAMRRAHRRFAPTRRSLHTIAAASLANLRFFSRIDASDGVWALREFPIPRSLLDDKRSIRADWILSPYPNLPWKQDWVTDQGRPTGQIAFPFFAQGVDNYLWKEQAWGSLRGEFTGGDQHPSTDYLIAYWLARAHGVISASD